MNDENLIQVGRIEGYDEGFWEGYNEGKEDAMRRYIIGLACELSSELLRLGDDDLTRKIAKEIGEDGGFTLKEEEDAEKN